jgi:NADH:ubiquinone oxidoreductase subunit 3 (subunit A)
MTFFFSEYFLLFFFFLFSFLLAIFILFIASFFSSNNIYSEKVSPYECGFDPFDNSRNQFEVRFYIIAILFLIFDLETSFLFPWAFSLHLFSSFGFWVIIDFFFEFSVGLFYVWSIGVFSWDLGV